ncbi:unnamed protein product [Brugia timori]|uniref:Uncharacterized protein n=1 Tax=Brugia timori TaxID=42155 RepID=A0A3P7YB21_9BILA|nr:unnamed protein product [Brugia timori]
MILVSVSFVHIELSRLDCLKVLNYFFGFLVSGFSHQVYWLFFSFCFWIRGLVFLLFSPSAMFIFLLFITVLNFVFLFSKQRNFELIIYLENYVFFISCNSYVFCYFIHNYYSYLIVFLVRLGVYFLVVISGLRRIFRESELTLKMVQVQEIFDYLLLIIAIDAFNGFLTMITFNFSCCGLFYVQCFQICDVNHRVLEELGGSQFNLNIYDLKLRVQEVLENMQNLFSFNTGLSVQEHLRFLAKALLLTIPPILITYHSDMCSFVVYVCLRYLHTSGNTIYSEDGHS